MIPLIEDYLRTLLVNRLEWLKLNPDEIPNIFGTLGRRSSLESLQNYVSSNNIRVMLGYPKEADKLPCYVITLAGEQEISAGLGDNVDEEIMGMDLEVNYHVDTIYVDSTYRIEVWSDNSDLAVYMYILAKWAMLVSRKEMLENNFLLPKVTGADLEPVPDYFPVFVYRRALMLNFQYENQFYEDEEQVETINGVIYNSEAYSKDI